MRHGTRIGVLAATAAVPLTALAIAACGGGGSERDPRRRRPRAVSAATIGLANEGNLGKILVNSRGRTLYLFQKDTGTTSECAGACAAAWPPLRADRQAHGRHGADASKIGTTAALRRQAAGHLQRPPALPLLGDQKPGDTNGQGLNAFGGAWFALSPGGRDHGLRPGSGSGLGY